MSNVFREHEGFQDARFQRDVFGVDFYPKEIEECAREPKPGWLEWRDVREYFGLGSMAVDQYALRDGYMSDQLYNALAKKIGKERLDKFFTPEGTPAPKVERTQQDINDLATLLVGTPEEIRAMRARRGNKSFF